MPRRTRSVFTLDRVLNKQGERVAELLHRHIGQCVDFYSRGESCHDDGAEAVDQSLDHQDTEIHH